MTRIAQVLLPLPVPEPFDYAEPEGMDLALGDIVAVPLGPRRVGGVVTGWRAGAGHNRPLKPILGRVDEPTLPPGALAFIDWVARYSVDWPGAPLSIALRGARAPKPRPERRLIATGQAPARITPARAKVLEAAGEAPIAPAALAAKAGVSSGVIKGLIDEGCLEERFEVAQAAFPEPDFGRPS